MIHGKTVFRNAATNYLREAVQVLVFLCLMPYIIVHLGVERFGLWSLIWASVYLLGLLDLGLSNAVIKFIADARGRGDGRRLQALTATFFWVYGGVALLIIGLAVTGRLWIAEILQLPQAEAETGARVFLILAIRLAQSLWLGMYKSVLIGYQRQMWVNLITICELVVYAILVMTVFPLHPSIETLALLNLGTNLAANIAITLLCCMRCGGISFLYTRMEWSLLREIMNFSWYFFIVQAALLIYGRVDTLIIHGFLSLSAVALYSVAQRIPEKAGAFCRQLTNALTPLFAELHGSGEQTKIRSAYMLGSKLSVAFATPVLGGLFWFIEDILRLWIGPEFTEVSAICRILLGAVFISVVHANGATALGMGSRALRSGRGGGSPLPVSLRRPSL